MPGIEKRPETTEYSDDIGNFLSGVKVPRRYNKVVQKTAYIRVTSKDTVLATVEQTDQ
jgi:hypothetical protein